MPYTLVQSEDLTETLLKLRKHDPQMYERLKKKMQQILENPHHYKSLSNVLKGCCRTQLGSFVLIFEIKESENAVRFIKFEHHDNAYK